MNISQCDLDADAAATGTGTLATIDPAGNSKKPARSTSCKPVRRSKKDQLIALLAKPNGARASVIAERLGWQAHTVRAALSGLRKQGHQITTSRSPKTGETIYAIAVQSVEQVAASDETSA